MNLPGKGKIITFCAPKVQIKAHRELTIGTLADEYKCLHIQNAKPPL